MQSTLNSTQSDEIELDLGKYFAMLAGQWRIILAALLVCALLGTAVAVFAPAPYEATAAVAMVKTRTDVQFDPRIRTLSADGTNAAPSESRRNALLGLVANSDIALKAIDKFKTRLSAEDFDPARMLNRVKGEIGLRGDLILIKVQDKDPVLAAEIATFWAREYERSINEIYGGTPEDYARSIKAELARAQSEFDRSQKALEDNLSSSQIEAIELKIGDKNRQIESLQANTQANATAELNRTLAAMAQVSALSESQQRARQLRQVAIAMLEQVRAGGDAAAASNAVPLLQIKLQAFGIRGFQEARPAGASGLARLSAAPTAIPVIGSFQSQPGFQVQVSLPTTATTADAQARDLEALVSALQSLDKNLGIQIDAAAASAAKANQSLLNATDPDTRVALERTLADLRDARSQLEREQARAQTLAQQRDLNRTTFNSLSNKQAEVAIANAVSNSEVRFASEAVAPVTRTQSRAIPIAGGAAAGFLLGFLLALGRGWMLDRRLPKPAAKA